MSKVNLNQWHSAVIAPSGAVFAQVGFLKKVPIQGDWIFETNGSLVPANYNHFGSNKEYMIYRPAGTVDSVEKAFDRRPAIVIKLVDKLRYWFQSTRIRNAETQVKILKTQNEILNSQLAAREPFYQEYLRLCSDQRELRKMLVETDPNLMERAEQQNKSLLNVLAELLPKR